MKITCFGEVLWDIFPDHKKVGGAPLNVALRLHAMGMNSSIISKVGSDTLGEDLITYIHEQGLSTEIIQKDDQYRTGEVLVALDEEGTASYSISRPVAWDFIDSNQQVVMKIQASDAIIFGSLVARSAISRHTLFELLDKARFKIFDVNLRPPHYDIPLLFELMKTADFIKMNDDELEEICSEFRIKAASLEAQIQAIADHTNTYQICITKGEKGATLFYKNVFYHHPGYTIEVVDTVGAGDSFLATLISSLLRGSEPQESLDYACAIGAMVAGSEGANPIFTDDEINTFMENR